IQYRLRCIQVIMTQKFKTIPFTSVGDRAALIVENFLKLEEIPHFPSSFFFNGMQVIKRSGLEVHKMHLKIRRSHKVPQKLSDKNDRKFVPSVQSYDQIDLLVISFFPT
uniref:hypothetical protein n=1 Tax=Salmonella sp. s51944 TaxID=3159655 RepID=UPI003980DF89